MLQGDLIGLFNYLVEIKKKMELGFSQRCTQYNESALKDERHRS